MVVAKPGLHQTPDQIVEIIQIVARSRQHATV
jgi:hypothetical protein